MLYAVGTVPMSVPLASSTVQDCFGMLPQVARNTSPAAGARSLFRIGIRSRSVSPGGRNV